jgi:hypothetical protein
MLELHQTALRRIASLLVAGAVFGGAARAESPPDFARASVADADAQPAEEAGWWREGIARLESLWGDTRSRLRDETPDSVHLTSRNAPVSPLPTREAGHAYIVLQEDRPNGMDLVTVRYPIAEQGALRTYAGAGLNHAQYVMDGTEAGSTLLTRRNPRRAVGPAAELGAELALNDRVSVNADLRWADLDERENLLQSAYGPVAADPVTVGFSVGYRFR